MPGWCLRPWSDATIERRWIVESAISISADEIDVSDAPSAEDLRWRLAEALPDRKPAAIRNFVRYWMQWLYEMNSGDIVIAPLTERRFAAGTIIGPPVRVDDPDVRMRHRRPVEWQVVAGERDALPESVRRITNLPATLTKIDQVIELEQILGGRQ